MLEEVTSRAGFEVRYADELQELATLPLEVPALPAAFVSREAFNALKELLLQPPQVDSDSPALKALGMGGSGKSVLAAALVRDSEVRRCYETVLWSNIGLESTIVSLQSELREQLGQGSFQRETNADEHANLKVLSAAAKGRKILLVMDDLWAEEQFQLLDCTNCSNGSRVLVTTRLRDVVASSTTVDLTVMVR